MQGVSMLLVNSISTKMTTLKMTTQKLYIGGMKQPYKVTQKPIIM